MLRFIPIILIFTLLASCKEEEKIPLVNYVNPMIGTGGHGHTYPGATLPFGMVQLSPDTRLEGWDGCSGYHNDDSVIYGFSHTHLSGTGVSDYGDILFMPIAGEIIYSDNFATGVYGYESKFNKETEIARPGYYSVHLTDLDIAVELTVTKRVGLHRYTFQADDDPLVIINLQHRDKLIDVNSTFGIYGDSLIEVVGHRISEGWATEQHVYFVARFSNRIKELEYLNGINLNNPDSIRTHTIVKFHPGQSNTLIVKVGISAVSIDNARENLEAEIPGWNFDSVQEAASAAWEKQLSKIEIETENKEHKEIFYTAMYHSMLAPNLFTDVDGSYRGMDMKIHNAKDKKQYTVFSLWDTFRATHPLFTLIQKERTNEFIQTLLRQYDDGGALPIWELAGNYTGCMIGYHSIPVIVDAYMKGIRDFDAEKALNAMVHSARQNHRGLESYITNGCVMAEEESESVSKTLEYAYDDWCIAIMAKELGKEDIYNEFIKRAQYYKNVFDPNTGFMRARINGSWFSPFDPSEVNFNYTEANSWQYSLFVPHDIEGLKTIMGGPDKLEHYLDNLFNAESETTGRHQADITGLIGQYAHGNEPSHHMAYLYNYIGKTWKTQERVHQILTTLYTNKPDGLAGNEDCGQMSSWYVLSSMGMYPVTPGSDHYVFGSPLFDRVTINLENGKKFNIIAEGDPDDIYIQSVELNGEAYHKMYITQADIDAGGELVFEMDNDPNIRWGAAPSYYPPSKIPAEKSITPAPYFSYDSRTFSDSMEVQISSAFSRASIYFTLNGSDPNASSTHYTEPIVISETSIIRAIVIKDDVGSFISETKLGKVDGNISITLNCKYANQYSAGGDNALIDMVKGNTNFRTGSWQGYQEDLIAIVDLGEVKTIDSISTGFLQDINSWVWFPTEVNYYTSIDGKKFTWLGSTEVLSTDKEYGPWIIEFTCEGKGINARYVKVEAINYGKCPSWHLGAGGQAWIFADEITIY